MIISRFEKNTQYVYAISMANFQTKPYNSKTVAYGAAHTPAHVLISL